MGVSRKVLDEDYILQVALLDPTARAEVEKNCIEPYFDIDQGGLIPTVDDYRDVALLEVRPPDVARYFVRVKPDGAGAICRGEEISAGLSDRDIEDEFVFQNSIRLNTQYYASLGDKRAFVLSHARNLIIVKIVGFAEAAVQYYRMPDTRAHVWIAHQRYPTKGRVWHPGGAHPFIGTERGAGPQRRLCQLPLGVASTWPAATSSRSSSPTPRSRCCLFDLWNRVYRYPMEYIIEALAPTTEMDFDRLPAEKQRDLPADPGGPHPRLARRPLVLHHRPQPGRDQSNSSLMGITDTAMLRPQVFALQEGEVSIGLICSEKQAIDATLASLASEDPRFTPVADMYWNARGGSSHRRRRVPADGFAPSRVVQRPPPLHAAGDRQVRQDGRHTARPVALQPLAAAVARTRRGRRG